MFIIKYIINNGVDMKKVFTLLLLSLFTFSCSNPIDFREEVDHHDSETKFFSVKSVDDSITIINQLGEVIADPVIKEFVENNWDTFKSHENGMFNFDLTDYNNFRAGATHKYSVDSEKYIGYHWVTLNGDQYQCLKWTIYYSCDWCTATKTSTIHDITH